MEIVSSYSQKHRKLMDYQRDVSSLTIIDDLPSDILLFHIFIRLPTKAVFRNKCVSKRWYSLISDHPTCPVLRDDDSDQASRPFTELFDLFDKNTHEVSHLCNVNGSSEMDHKFSLTYLPISISSCDGFRIWASYQDLILCRSTSSPFYLTNLFTKRWVMLPPSENSFLFERRNIPRSTARFLDFIHGNELVGLICMDPRSFWVVRIANCSFYPSFTMMKAQVFSSITGLWESVDISCTQNWQYAKWHRGVPCNGKLYWWTLTNGLLEFDPSKMVEEPNGYGDCFRFIDGPCLVNNLEINRCVLGSYSCHGSTHLRFTQLIKKRRLIFNCEREFKIWELSGDQSWCLKYTLYLSDFLTEDADLHLHLQKLSNLSNSEDIMYFHPHDGDILYLRLHHRTIVCNFRSRSLELVPSGCYSSSKVRVMAGSFLVLPQPWQPLSVHSFFS